MKYTQSQGNEFAFIILIVVSAFAYKVYLLLSHYYQLIKPLSPLFFIVLMILVLIFILYRLKNKLSENKDKNFLIGFDNKKPIYINEKIRTTHAQILGTTGSGKTESIILPWIIQDIRNGKGVLIIDGKSDSDFLNKLYGYIVNLEREKDFKLFSLANIDQSYSFNPLNGQSSIEVAERVFSAFTFENEYYRNIQYKIFLSLISLIREKTTPTFKLIHFLLTDMEALSNYLLRVKNPRTKTILDAFKNLPEREREERVSGLESQLSHFAQGDCHCLFDDEKNSISINQALKDGQILYFQLPTMLYPFLAQATGKLVLQGLQSAVARRHLEQGKDRLFSVYLDDFQDYIYRGFGALLNKSRSANIAMVFSHQSLGDLERVSVAFRDVVLTNTNLKVVMRVNDPKTCDYFAKSFGTESSSKMTEQTDEYFLGKSRTGKGTLRKVEEYIFHPNIFKKMPIGSGVVSIPQSHEVSHLKLNFSQLKDIEKKELPYIRNSKIEANPSLNLIKNIVQAKQEKSKNNLKKFTKKRSRK